MAARRTSTVGLTDQDVQRLRDQLDRRPAAPGAGVRPQFADATSATVVRVGDPAVDGTDYLTVRVKVNGVLDELAFAPAELNLGRAQPGRPAGRSAAAKPAPRPGRPQATRPPSRPSPRDQRSTDHAGHASHAGHRPASRRAPAADRRPVPPPPAASTAGRGSTGSGHTGQSAGRSSRPSAQAGPRTEVSFTVASTGASWTVSASRGAKGIVKNVPVQPGVVTALAELLDQPALLDAVAEINETALSQAQARAEQLRAELDRLEAVLATHRAPTGRTRR